MGERININMKETCRKTPKYVSQVKFTIGCSAQWPTKLAGLRLIQLLSPSPVLVRNKEDISIQKKKVEAASLQEGEESRAGKHASANINSKGKQSSYHC